VCAVSFFGYNSAPIMGHIKFSLKVSQENIRCYGPIFSELQRECILDLARPARLVELLIASERQP
jgi:hypothetical protein